MEFCSEKSFEAMKQQLYKLFGKHYTWLAILYRQVQTYCYSIIHPLHYEVDLTNETSNKKLILSASLSSMGNDIGSIYIKTNNDLESSNNYSSSALSLYGKGSNSHVCMDICQRSLYKSRYCWRYVFIPTFTHNIFAGRFCFAFGGSLCSQCVFCYL